MIFTLIIVLGVGLVHAELHWYDIPGFFLEKPSATSFLASIDGLVVDKTYSEDKLLRSDIRTSLAIRKPEQTRLTDDERVAIALYTTSNSAPRLINKVLRTFNETALRVWSQYLKLFYTGLKKLPPTAKRLCRGVPLLLYDSNNKSLIGSTVPLLSLSFSTDGRVCEFYGDRTQVPGCNVFWMQSITARDIIEYTLKPDEEEYVLLPGTLAKILSITPLERDRCSFVEMQELAPNDPAYRPPYPVNVVNIGTLTDIEGKKIDDFLRVYVGRQQQVRVGRGAVTSIQISGGFGTFSVWPRIDRVLNVPGGAPLNLQGNFIVSINGYSTRGLFITDVKRLMIELALNNGAVNLGIVPRIS